MFYYSKGTVYVKNQETINKILSNSTKTDEIKFIIK